MTLKQFLKPDWRKILLTIILIVPSFMIENCIGLCLDCGFNYAIPLSFYCSMEGPFHFAELSSSNYPLTTSLAFSIIDIIFWYLISCLIVWVYDKFRKR